MKVIVCGGRDYLDWESVRDTLDGIPGISFVVQGGASGADRLARDWAVLRKADYLSVRARWDEHGKAAGPIRNQKMLEVKPDLVVAFPGGKGTADMVRRAKAAGVPVREISP